MTTPAFRNAANLPALASFLNALATLQLVWFYMSIPAALNLEAYEAGRERFPFQERMLMMGPLRWAHHSAGLARLAHALTRNSGWFAHPGASTILPETLMQAAINVAAVAITGLIARKLYRASSASGLLTPLIYPLTLVMIAATDCFAVNHALRFVYDLPAMALFSAGLYMIYCRASPLLFAALFLVATLNRETALLLLPVYWVTCALPWRGDLSRRPALRLVQPRARPAGFAWHRLYAPASLGVVLPLGFAWLAWHHWAPVWLRHHYGEAPNAEGPRLLLNLATLVTPVAWPQVCSVAAYLWPIPLLAWRRISDATLRGWAFLPLLWFVMMLKYGLLLETRVFGELIAYFATTTALLAEEWVIGRLRQGLPAAGEQLHRRSGCPGPVRLDSPRKKT